MAYDGSIKIDTKINTSEFKKGFSNLKSIAKTGCKVIASAITAVSAGIGALGTAAVKVGSDFETKMSEVSAISGATGKDIETLTAKAKEMGATTKFSASESAEALKYMAMAGWKTKDMVDGLSGVMNLAAASGEDLGTTSDIVTDALTAFGLQAKDSEHFADVLATTSSSANTNVSMLGESFKYVAPLCGTLGYSAEDCAVALGIMANSGIKGSQAGTTLKTALANLSAPTKEMKGVMDKLVISMTDESGKMKSLKELTGDLREKFSKLDKAQQSEYASTLFGKEAMSGMLAIINASEEDYNKLTQAIENCDGSSKNMADTMNDNLQGKVTILKSGLEGLGIQIYESVQEPLKNLADEGIQAISRLSKAYSKNGLSGIAKSAGNVFGDIISKAAKLAPKVVKLAVDFIKGFVDGLKKNKAKILVAGKEIIKSLADGVIGFLPKGLQEPVSKIFKSIGDVITNLKEPVQKTIEILKQSLSNGGLKHLFDSISDIVSNILKVLGQIAGAVLPIIAGAVDVIAEVLNGVLVLFKPVFDMFGGMTETVDETTQALKDEIAVIDENIENFQELKRESADTAHIDYLKDLNDELDTLVDENGKIKKGYEDRVNFITGELQNGLGVEIEINNGVIKNYKILQDEIKKTIALKRANIILENEETAYRDAINNQTGATAKLSKLKKDLDEISLKYEKAADNYNSVAEKIPEVLDKWNMETDPEKAWNLKIEYENLVDQTSEDSELYKNMKTFQSQYFAAKNAYAKQQKLVGDYASAIAQYETDAARIASGKAEEIEKVNERIYESYDETGRKIKKSYEQQLKETEASLEAMIVAVKKGDKEITQERIDEAQRRVDELKKKLDAEKKAVGEKSKEIGLTAALSLIQGVESQEEKVKAEGSKVGQYLVSGMESGIKAQSPQFYSALNFLTDNTIKTVSDNLDIHSPSRVMKNIFAYVIEGAVLGLKENAEKLNKQADNTTGGFVKRMKSGLNSVEMIKKMKSAVISANADLASELTAKATNPINLNDREKTVTFKGNIHTSINIDGRETAVALTPYMSEELAF